MSKDNIEVDRWIDRIIEEEFGKIMGSFSVTIDSFTKAPEYDRSEVEKIKRIVSEFDLSSPEAVLICCDCLRDNGFDWQASAIASQKVAEGTIGISCKIGRNPDQPLFEYAAYSAFRAEDGLMRWRFLFNIGSYFDYESSQQRVANFARAYFSKDSVIVTGTFKQRGVCK